MTRSVGPASIFFFAGIRAEMLDNAGHAIGQLPDVFQIGLCGIQLPTRQERSGIVRIGSDSSERLI